MKTNFRIGASGAALILAMGMNSAAYAGDNANANASVKVLKPLTLEKTSDMNFGLVAVNGAGTMVLDIEGGLTCSSDLICQNDDISVAAFKVSEGSPNRSVTVILPSANIDLVLDGVAGATATPAQKIVLSEYSTNLTQTKGKYTVRLGNNGSDAPGEATFVMGGKLTLDAAQSAGQYSGEFTVSVDYS